MPTVERKIGINYGEIVITLRDRTEESWSSVDLDTVKVEDGILSFRRLRHGDCPCRWGVVHIPMEIVLIYETIADKD